MILQSNINYASGTRLLRLLFVSSLLIFTFYSCSKERTYPPIETHTSSPIDVAVSDPDSDQKKHFFVLNADFNHIYQSGSVLMIKHDGSEKRSHAISRLGRSIKVAGDKMLITFDENSGQNEESKTELYSIQYAANDFPTLNLERSWNLGNCRALNSTLRKDYQYFAVTCENGSIYVGTFDNSDLSKSTLDKVRQFPGYVHRALHFDTQRNRLYTFMTDMNRANFSDGYLKDAQTWDAQNTELVNGSNDVPDKYENTLRARIHLQDKGNSYIFSIIDLNNPENQEEDGTFKYRKYADVQNELHWMYFTTNDKNNAAELPEIAEDQNKSDYKYYRNNFWEVTPDTSDSSESGFYLSQRGGSFSPHSNNLIHMKLTSEEDLDGKHTADIFEFTRVYGSSEQKSDTDYLGCISFARVADKKVLLVNHFRSQKDFDRSHFSIKAFAEDGTVNGLTSYLTQTPLATIESSQTSDGTFFQFAVSDEDSNNVHVLVTSFFQDTVKLYKLDLDGFTAIGDDFR